MEAIYGKRGVKAGFTNGICTENLVAALDAVIANGAEAAILGCTELPLIELPQAQRNRIPLVDPTSVLARACVAAATV